jgi:hypothetical protein
VVQRAEGRQRGKIIGRRIRGCCLRFQFCVTGKYVCCDSTAGINEEKLIRDNQGISTGRNAFE